MIEALQAFCLSPELRDADGQILSWLNPAKPGYGYEEITAVYAHLEDWLGEDRGARDTCARALERGGGWLQRGGVRYTFDTALAARVFPEDEALRLRLFDDLDAGVACEPVQRPGWWSETLGAHHIKAACIVGNGKVSGALRRDCWTGERFRIHPASEWTYLHAHCYALEGIYWLGEPDVMRAGCDFLASLQDADGAIPSWTGPGAPPAIAPADVTAQALRLWTLVDRERYAEARAIATARLERLQDPVTGGIRYTLESGDINSWASAFALQALIWQDRAPSTDETPYLL